MHGCPAYEEDSGAILENGVIDRSSSTRLKEFWMRRSTLQRARLFRRPCSPVRQSRLQWSMTNVGAELMNGGGGRFNCLGSTSQPNIKY